ncbi:hypothetical protein ACJBXD_10470 [Streptococcus suis]
MNSKYFSSNTLMDLTNGRKKPKERFDGDEMAKLAEVIGVDPQKVLAAILIS